MNYSTIKTAGPRKPRRVVIFPPTGWSDEHENKPDVEVAIGIRTMSEDETQVAQAEAAKKAIELIPDGDLDDKIQAYNDHLMREAVAAACCDPNDINRPYFALREPQVRVQLSSAGTRRLFEEVQAHIAAEDPSMPEATAGDLEYLAAVDFDALPPDKARYVRRHLAIVVDEIRRA